MDTTECVCVDGFKFFMSVITAFGKECSPKSLRQEHFFVSEVFCVDVIG